MDGCRDGRHSRKHAHKLELWAELEVGIDVHVVPANVPGWQCWTAVGIRGAATGSGYAGWGMGGATSGGGHAQHETGGGDGDAGMLGEVSGANTGTSTLVYLSTISSE